MRRELLKASAAFKGGRLEEASSALAKVVAQSPKNFEAHELLGLTYGAQQQSSKAVMELRTAVDLKPSSAVARDNLGTALIRGGDFAGAETQYRKAIECDPSSYEAYRHLAGLLLRRDRFQEALPLLQRAQQLRPNDTENQYDLAEALLLAGRPGEAEAGLKPLLTASAPAELHNLGGRIAEAQGRYLDAIHEFETAAHEDPSEENIFVWGSDLLAHRTYVPAIDVFRAGSQRYPDSPRLLVGLGMALYAHGDNEESVQALLRAVDLSPKDARGYLYLSKAYLGSSAHTDEVIRCFQRYAELEPSNALAVYYYAMSLWKGKRLESSSPDYAKIRPLLERSIALNGDLAESHLQLGILYSEQHEMEKARLQYQRALELAPQVPEAHFRMGRYLLAVGLKDKADGEFATFKRLQDQKHATEDKAKAEVQQFVVAEPAAPAANP